MVNGIREIKRRIKSVKNTGKITRAMEMVAAAKMRKAISAVLATRDYANLAWATVMHLAERTDPKYHPLLQQRKDVKRVGLILISSNRGLCGSFNLQVVQKAASSVRKHEKSIAETEVLALGSRGRDIIRSMGFNVVADFIKEGLTLRVADVSAVSRLVIKNYIDQTYDKVFLAFTDYISTMKQVPRVKQLLPILPKEDEFLGVVGKSRGIETTKSFIKEKKEKYLRRGDFIYEYVFEPTPDIVLREMLPRLIETQIYQAVLESEASEHCARMISMKNAKEASSEMINNLTVSFNRARQANITQEISEICSAAEALKK